MRKKGRKWGGGSDKRQEKKKKKRKVVSSFPFYFPSLVEFFFVQGEEGGKFIAYPSSFFAERGMEGGREGGI